MPDTLAQLRVDGLTSLQLAELKAAIATTGGDYVTTLENPSLGGDKVGEPITLTVVITLAAPVIGALALWIAKQKGKRRVNLEYTRTDGKGGTEKLKMDESTYGEGESSPEAIRTFLEKGLGRGAARPS
jgi:hypothetical protein